MHFYQSNEFALDIYLKIFHYFINFTDEVTKVSKIRQDELDNFNDNIVVF